MMVGCQQNDVMKISPKWMTPFFSQGRTIELHLYNRFGCNYNNY
jgi:hypothetical protein